MNDFNERYKEFKSLMPTLAKEYGFELLEILNKSLRKQFERKNDNPFSSYGKNRLTKRTGKLLDSYEAKSPNTLSKVGYSSNKLSINWGSNLPYAEIHEKGGFIKAKKKASSVKTKREVFVMEQFFWRKFIESKNEIWKRIALSVRKNKGIKMPARGYFNAALSTFRDEYKDKFIQQKRSDLLKAWEATK
jgi:phage gpG-like protein